MEKITNTMLMKNSYDMETLKNNIDHLDLISILNTQELTVDFCVDIILNEKYQVSSEEKNIDLLIVINKQPHLCLKELFKKFS